MPDTNNAAAGGLPACRAWRTDFRPMIGTVVFIVLLSQASAAQTTLPRHRDADPVEQRPTPETQPADPYFDRKFVATDDAAFVLSAVESARLESIAKRKGGRLPDGNPDRTPTAPNSGEYRAAANFIVNQISYHENTV